MPVAVYSFMLVDVQMLSVCVYLVMRGQGQSFRDDADACVARESGGGHS